MSHCVKHHLAGDNDFCTALDVHYLLNVVAMRCESPQR